MQAKLSEIWMSDPIKTLALIAALIAFATTPVAFAILGRLNWFEARRGRVMMRPSFISIFTGMALVMAIPAIFAILVVKSADFDHNRYEFDPNKTWSVLEQGREFKSVQAADKAVRDEMERLGEMRKNLVNGVKKLDEAMLTLRSASAQSLATAQAVPPVLERLATIRRAVGVDGPQQLMDFTAPAVTGPITGTGNSNLATNPSTQGTANASGIGGPAVASATGSTFSPNGSGVAEGRPGIAPVPPRAGLTEAEAKAEYAQVPEPQRALASMLPLADLPSGWEVAKIGARHLESFNDQNMFEKIDGRAESFTQNNVTGMAYATYHPIGDDSNEVQLYIFEFDHSKPLRAQSKYQSEKPEESKKIDIGTEGYTSAGSLLFFVDPYYTQIVSTVDDPKFADFAVAIARRIAKQQTPATVASAGGGEDGEGEGQAKPPSAASTAEALFAILPAEPGKASPQFVASDVFGYGFLSDVFMADYKEGEVTWQGFIRPYPSADEAKKVVQTYQDAAKKDGGTPKPLTIAGADEAVMSTNVGLTDVFFRRGGVLAGVSGATDAAKAEAFARAFAAKLPATVPGAGAK